MILIFPVEILALGLLHFYTKNKYAEFCKSAGKRDRLNAIIMPSALFITDKIISGRFSGYERKLAIELSELYGVRDVKGRLRFYIAEKTVNMIAVVLAVTLLGTLPDKLDIGYMVFAFTTLIIAFYAPDRKLCERIKRKNFYIQYDFPDFLNKLVLLINAGMTVPRAWERIVGDRGNMTPLYEELNVTYLEIRNGKSETAAYEDFARRCRVREITKFVTLIIQNLRKGNGELVSLLKLQSNECWQLRKNMAKRLGEEASTKLILPLMIMFVGILVIVLLPAVMQLKYL